MVVYDVLKPIKKTKEQIWNERFEKRMKERNLSQRNFIALYKEKFGTGSQSDVSNWMNVGSIDSKTKKPRGFPEFETMRKIAEILEVSVGYLIGETDYETFDMEQVAKYMGLSSSAILAVRSVTSGKAIPPFYKYSDPRRTAALEKLLKSSLLVEYLKNIYKLAEAINKERNPKRNFEEVLGGIPEEYQTATFALWHDAEEAIQNGIEPTAELWDFVKKLDDAAYKDFCQPDMIDCEIKSAKYVLQEIHMKMINEIVSDDDIKQLLPNYATKEELEEIIRTVPFKDDEE